MDPTGYTKFIQSFAGRFVHEMTPPSFFLARSRAGASTTETWKLGGGAMSTCGVVVAC